MSGPDTRNAQGSEISQQNLKADQDCSKHGGVSQA